MPLCRTFTSAWCFVSLASLIAGLIFLVLELAKY